MNSGSYKLLARAVEEACSGGLPRANSPFPSCLQSQDPGETKPCGGTKYRRECWNLPNGTSRRWSLQCFKASRVGSRLPIFLRFPSIKVFFNSVETKWVPEAYLYRLGLNQLCSSDPRGKLQGFLSLHRQERQNRQLLLWLSRRWAECQHRLLGAVWMLHQEGGVVRGESWILPLSLWISPRRFSWFREPDCWYCSGQMSTASVASYEVREL